MCMLWKVTWRSEDSSWELILSVHLVGPRDQTQVFRLCDKPLYPLVHLTGPTFSCKLILYY